VAICESVSVLFHTTRLENDQSLVSVGFQPVLILSALPPEPPAAVPEGTPSTKMLFKKLPSFLPHMTSQFVDTPKLKNGVL